jgi:farnesyl-diphosphate farnesyltransferase
MTLTRLGRDADFSLMPELFPSRVRARIQGFGRFVRLADGIADDVALTRDQRLSRLDALEAMIKGGPGTDWSEEARQVSREMRDSLRASPLAAEHALHVTQAFRRDVSGVRIQTWNDLLVYCGFSAAPIGRYMLDLMGEDPAVCGRSTDALCAALRILKRLRDCKEPSVQYKRLCIPEKFMWDAAITTLHLQAPSAKGQTRAVIDRVLDGVDRLLIEAAPLPRLIGSRGLSLHTAIVLCRARTLARHFRERDPLNERVELTGWERLKCKWLCKLKAFLPWT